MQGTPCPAADSLSLLNLLPLLVVPLPLMPSLALLDPLDVELSPWEKVLHTKHAGLSPKSSKRQLKKKSNFLLSVPSLNLSRLEKSLLIKD